MDLKARIDINCERKDGLNLTKICSVYFEILALWQKCTHKQEVGQPNSSTDFFLFLIILKTKVPLRFKTLRDFVTIKRLTDGTPDSYIAHY